MSNEETEALEIVENLATEQENTDLAFENPIAQNLIVVAEELRDDSDIAVSPSVPSHDDITVVAESTVVEIEDDSEDSDREHEESDSEEAEEDDEVIVPLASAKASEYCFLCRSRFFPFYFINEPNSPRYQDWLSENPEEKWQSEIRAVLRLPVPHGEDPVMTDAVVLDTLAVNVSLVGRPKSGKVVLNSRPDLDFHIDTVAYCFHDWCYSIFDCKSNQNSAEVLYEMATNFKVSTAWENPAESNGSLYPEFDCDILLSTLEDASARFQPFFLSKLPLEIRSRIWSYVGFRSAYSAFMLVTGETSRLAQQVSRPNIRELIVKPNCYIGVSSINIYGTTYIRDFGRHVTSGTRIKISKTVTEIEVVSSVHGICSIRFSGCDWASRWLGRSPKKGRIWYGTIQLTSNVLIGFHNGLCIENLTDAYKSDRIQVMWDQPHHPPVTFDADAAMFSLFEPEQLYQQRLPDLAFFRFVSLIDHGEYISGLTIRGAVAVHVSLASGELIGDVWLRLNSDCPFESVPSVLIQTTSGREFTFGPYVGPVQYKNYSWVLLTHTGCVSGFYFENAPQIRRIGIVSDGKDAPNAETRLPRYETCKPMPPYLGNPQFVNDAIIHDLEAVTMCRVGTRCVGILIRYLDADLPPAILGQWYGPEYSEHTCIYNCTKMSSSVIAFKTSKFSLVVRDIFFSNHDTTELEADSSVDIELQVYDMGTRIAWWFTGRHDSINTWEDRLDPPSSGIPSWRTLVQDLY
ncbi:hypothetical protein SBOR_2976 [Sclerotinia borealis F-4128]|uniref:Uncharacterized protein n=1 Tax=Sclerotinia borealis (strain F-4128) TaxID=1432307 RepID=W9CPP9_SCLBF|nr:hypothetical protein SBOR_2976 [Sclerotinia borealis F-4128]